MQKFTTDIELGDNNILKNGVAQAFGNTLNDNGTPLNARANLNIVGANYITQDADNTNLYLFRNQPEFLQYRTYNWLNNSSKYTRIMRKGGFWYLGVNKFDSLTSMESNSFYQITVFKSADLISWTPVVTFTRPSGVTFEFTGVTTQILVLNNGDIALLTYVWNGTDTVIYCQYNSTPNISSVVAQSGVNNVGRFSAIEGANGEIAIFYLAKGGATSYWQLAFAERSAGTSGTFGTPVWIGNNPVRDTLQYLRGFLASDGYYRVIYMDPSTATSSKLSVAKQTSGGWTVYNTTETVYADGIIYGNDLYFFANSTYRFSKFTDSTNTFDTNWTYLSTGQEPQFIGIYEGYLYYYSNASLASIFSRIFRLNMSTKSTQSQILTTVTNPILYFTDDATSPIQYQPACSMHPLDDGAYLFCRRTDGLIFHKEVSSLWA